MELNRTERRVLGTLIEKRWTTPENYPLSLNALTAGCNQKSNRDPVLHLQEFEISGCILELRQRGLMMLHESYTARVPKYSERLQDQIALSRQQGAILAELMLRGPQSQGELLRRCERMAPFAGQDEVAALLREMAGMRLTRVLPRESGKRHSRWDHCVAAADEAGPEPEEASDAAASTPSHAAPSHGAPSQAAPSQAAQPQAAQSQAVQPGSATDGLAALRAEVEALRTRVTTLERELGLAAEPEQG